MTALVLLICLARLSDVANGFHDSANSVATVVSTKVLSPAAAVLWAAFFNFIAFLVFKTRVWPAASQRALTSTWVSLLPGGRGRGRRHRLGSRSPGGLALPTSSSHALVGGLGGRRRGQGRLQRREGPLHHQDGRLHR